MRSPLAAMPALLLVFVGACGGNSSGNGVGVFNGWARRVGGQSLDKVAKTAVCPDGSVVATGCFSREVVFGRGTPNQTVLQSFGDTDMFVARYSAQGTFLWARGAGGPLNEEGLDVDVAADGSVLVTGFYKDGSVFGSGEPTQVVLSGPDQHEANLFVARYAANGFLSWVAVPSPDSRSVGNGIGALPDGSCVVAGSFSDAATFGPGEAHETTMLTDGGAMFVARYAPDGTLAWAREGSTTGFSSAAGVDTLDDGTSYVVGTFVDDLTLGSGPSTPVSVPRGSGFFVARYDGDGVPQWIRAGGLDADYVPAGDVAALPDHTCVVIGSYDGAPTFGVGEVNETQLPDAGAFGDENVFFGRYGSGGELLWARGEGGVGYQFGRGIAVRPDASIWITGDFAEIATFGLGEANEKTLIGSGLGDVFLGRLFSNGDLRWVKRIATGSEFDTQFSGGVSVRSDDSSIVSGQFGGTFKFGIGSFQETLITQGGWDGFLARFGPNGEF